MSVLPLILGAVLQPSDGEIARLVEAHSRSVGLLRSVRVEYVTTMINDPDRFAEAKWLKNGDRERFWTRDSYTQPGMQGRPRNIREFALDREGYRLLMNWDADHPQKITPSRQGTLRAETGPRSAQNPTMINPAYGFLLEMQLAPRRSLSDLSRSAARAEYRGNRPLREGPCEVLAFELPSDHPPLTVEVWLDPAVGFLARRIVHRVAPTGTNPGRVTFAEAAQFQSLGDGVFFPTHCRYGGCEFDREPSDSDFVSESKTTRLEVNSTIADTELALDFPKYAQVSRMPSVDGRIAVDVWGDGAPIRRINNVKDIEALERELMRDPAVAAEFAAASQFSIVRPVRQRWWEYVLPAALVAAVVAAIWWRVRSTR